MATKKQMVTSENVTIGMRVVRGRDFEWEDSQDNNGIGTVEEIETNWCGVKWDDNDTLFYYRIGAENGKLDLYIDDGKPYVVPKVLAKKLAQLKVGDVVRFKEKSTLSKVYAKVESLDEVHVTFKSGPNTLNKYKLALYRSNADFDVVAPIKYNDEILTKRLVKVLEEYESPNNSKENLTKDVLTNINREKSHYQLLGLLESNDVKEIFKKFMGSFNSDSVKIEAESGIANSYISYYGEGTYRIHDYTRAFLRNLGFPREITEKNLPYQELLRQVQEFKKFGILARLRGLIESTTCNEALKQYLLSNPLPPEFSFVEINRMDKNIEFTPKGKFIEFDGNYKLSSKNRQSIAPHKFFNKILKGVEGATEYDIKCFADQVISMVGNYTVEFVKGKEIAKMYQQLTMDDWCCTNNCMRNKPEAYFKIYTENDAFELGIIKLNGEIVARFLKVSAVDARDKEFTYHDRIYYKDEETLAWYNNWIDANGFVRKYANNHTSFRDFYSKKEGGHFTKKVIVKIPEGYEKFEEVYDNMPYMDTLRYGGDGFLTNDNSGTRPKYHFESTGGDYGGKYTEWCERSNNFYHRDEMVTIGMGAGEGERVRSNLAQYSSANNTYLLR